MKNLGTGEIPISTTPVSTTPVCCAGEISHTGTRLHIALNVTEMGRSVEFYRILFGVRPQKQESDYAKFELDLPPLVCSLIAQTPTPGQGLRHLAFPVYQRDEVSAVGRRWSTAGLNVTWESEGLCDDQHHSSASVTDPDGNVWMIVCRYAPPTSASLAHVRNPTIENPARQIPDSASIAWEHRISSPWLGSIPHSDGSLDLVRLEGTFNAELTASERRGLISEVRRVLKPGCRVFVHGLVSSAPLAASPSLPGLASIVRQIPTEAEPGDELLAAGFVDLWISRLPDKPAFRAGNVALREIKLTARTPRETGGDPRLVMYRGPFRSVTTDAGITFLRGIPANIDSNTWLTLQAEPWREAFLWLDVETRGTHLDDCHSH